MDGDTLIGANFYHQLYIHGYTYFTMDSYHLCPPFFRGIGFQGAIREDTIARKVYMWNSSDSTDVLLFDFTLQIGDTVKGILAPASCAIVTSIDSVECSDGWRKMWEYTDESGRETNVIEGIGSMSGMMEHSCTVVGNFSATLNCFSQNNLTIYPPDSTWNCEIIDGIEQSNSEKARSAISIFPNPFSSTATIRINLPLKTSAVKLKVYNSFGVLTQIENATVNNGGTEIIIRRGNLNVGIYFFELHSLHTGLCGNGKFIIF